MHANKLKIPLKISKTKERNLSCGGKFAENINYARKRERERSSNRN
jgi:hypothetical protein